METKSSRTVRRADVLAAYTAGDGVPSIARRLKVSKTTIRRALPVSEIRQCATAILSWEAEEFLRLSGMAEDFFGTRAAGDPELMGRLRSGGILSLSEIRRIRRYLGYHQA